MAKNCWKSCSPLGTGLGLALIVSISFLIVMIIIYLCSDRSVGNVFSSTKYECSQACRCVEDFGRLVLDFHSPLGGSTEPIDDLYARGISLSPDRSQMHQTVCLGRNYPIAAILKRTYLDDFDSFEYLTSAVILSSKWLLSSVDFLNDTSTKSLYAAIGTRYWSKNGYLHHVSEKASIQNVLTVIKLELEIIIAIDFVRLISGIKAETISITSWKETLKYKKATEKQLSVIDSSFCDEASFCTRAVGGTEEIRSSLAISDNQLYGFYDDTLCVDGKCVHRFRSIKPYIFYLYDVIYENKYNVL